MNNPTIRDSGPVRGWQYDPANPLAALLNAMEAAGRYVNPFNRRYMGLLSQQAFGAVPQFLSSLMGAQDFGQEGAPGLQERFGSFLQQLIGGQVQPWGMGSAGGFLQKYADLMRETSSQMRGPTSQVDWNDPASVKAALSGLEASKQISPLQSALAGYGLGDEEFQQKMYLGAYAPILGPTFTRGLGNIAAAKETLWDRLLGAGTGMAELPDSFLDLLLGRLGSAGTPGSRGASMSFTPEGNIMSVGGRYPGGANTARVPGNPPNVYGPTMGGYANPAGQMFNQVPPQRSILERLMELLGTGGIRR